MSKRKKPTPPPAPPIPQAVRAELICSELIKTAKVRGAMVVVVAVSIANEKEESYYVGWDGRGIEVVGLARLLSRKIDG
jgi:hypothetical protein